MFQGRDPTCAQRRIEQLKRRHLYQQGQYRQVRRRGNRLDVDALSLT